MKNWITPFLLCISLFSTYALSNPHTEPTEDQSAYAESITKLWNSMELKTGTIELAGNTATLEVPETFYYLSPSDAQTVLTDIWGNPPEAANGILGMLFPTGTTPLDNSSWGVTIEYQQDGYVSDDDVDDIDYDKLLIQMQDETEQSSQYRVEQGYEAISLVGWAAPPFYDKQSNKLHWAKEIKFGNNEVNTLNYNIRILGRRGVLILNFIAGMDQYSNINTKLDTVLAMAEFNQGSRYADFNPDLDKIAAYGIGTLIAGKALAKTGFLAAAFLLLKKFGVIILIAIGAFVKKLIGRKKTA